MELVLTKAVLFYATCPVRIHVDNYEEIYYVVL
jgi:hypothetical protein